MKVRRMKFYIFNYRRVKGRGSHNIVYILVGTTLLGLNEEADVNHKLKTEVHDLHFLHPHLHFLEQDDQAHHPI